MHNKLLFTYTLLGLMFISLSTHGQAGKFEDAFLDEVGKGCPRLLCTVYKNGTKCWEDKFYRETKKVGETTYYSNIGTISQPHYETTSYWIKGSDNWECSSCFRKFNRGLHKNLHPSFRIQRHYYLDSDTITLERDDGYTKPCARYSVPGNLKDPFDIILHKYGCHNSYPYFYYGLPSWSKVLGDLWTIAINLDLKEEEDAIALELDLEEKKYAEKRLEEQKRRPRPRQVNEEGCVMQ